MTPAELAALVSQASDALQYIQNEHDRNNVVAARVRFPRGFIRPIDAILPTLPRVGTTTQRRNACYLIMKLDVSRWLLVRTDLWGAPLSMIVKEGIFSLASICEWMAKEALVGRNGGHRFTSKTARMVALGWIDSDQKDELDWMWDLRCRAHFGEVTSLEYEEYSREDYNRALRTYNALRKALKAEFG